MTEREFWTEIARHLAGIAAAIKRRYAAEEPKEPEERGPPAYLRSDPETE